MSKIKLLLILLFLVIPVIYLSPITAPYGRVRPFIWGVPFTLFLWFVLNLVLIALIVVLYKIWRPKE